MTRWNLSKVRARFVVVAGLLLVACGGSGIDILPDDPLGVVVSGHGAEILGRASGDPCCLDADIAAFTGRLAGEMIHHLALIKVWGGHGDGCAVTIQMQEGADGFVDLAAVIYAAAGENDQYVGHDESP